MSYIFGGNTGQSLSDIQRRRQQAQAMQAQAGHFNPREPGSGLRSAAQSIMAGYLGRKANQAEAKGRGGYQSALRDLLQTRGSAGVGNLQSIMSLADSGYASPSEQSALKALMQQKLAGQGLLGFEDQKKMYDAQRAKGLATTATADGRVANDTIDSRVAEQGFKTDKAQQQARGAGYEADTLGIDRSVAANSHDANVLKAQQDAQRMTGLATKALADGKVAQDTIGSRMAQQDFDTERAEQRARGAGFDARAKAVDAQSAETFGMEKAKANLMRTQAQGEEAQISGLQMLRNADLNRRKLKAEVAEKEGKISKQSFEDAERAAEIDGKLQTFEDLRRTSLELRESDGLKYITGGRLDPVTPDWTRVGQGRIAADLRAQLIGIAKLKESEKMKGVLSDSDFKMLEESVRVFSNASTEEEAKKALNQYNARMLEAENRYRKRYGRETLSDDVLMLNQNRPDAERQNQNRPDAERQMLEQDPELAPIWDIYAE